MFPKILKAGITIIRIFPFANYIKAEITPSSIKGVSLIFGPYVK